MGATELLAHLGPHRIVGWDTSLFIYHFEEHPTYSPLTRELFAALEQGKLEVVTSVIALAEIVTKPLINGDHDLAFAYRHALSVFPNLTFQAIGVAEAMRGAEVRARWGLRLPDALQIAACAEAGATAFLTNDVRLQKVTALEVVTLQDYR